MNQPHAFTLEEERYLINQISQGDDRVATKALQWLCERSRAGAFFADANKIRAVVRLSLHRTLPSARRWAVNTLSEIGTGDDLSPIIGLVPYTESDPDLLAAIVAAVFSHHSDEKAVTALTKVGVPIEGLALIAASQFSTTQKKKLVETLVPLETTDAGELRAAIILAGKKQAPEHLFDKKFTNAIALSELNLHDTPSVSKYSIWALAQLGLGFSSLQLPLSKLESSPAEVRKWVFRLLFSDEHALSKNLDLLETAQRDPSSDVREESAIELRDIFVPGIETYVSNWLFREDHGEAQSSLLDHMAAQSDKTEHYSPIVLEFYRKYNPKSNSRIRLEAAAAGRILYKELRKLELQEESGLLFDNDNDIIGVPNMVVNQTFHNSQIGSVTGSGSINAETINAVSQSDDITRQILEKVMMLLITLPDEKRTQGEQIIQEVAAKPTHSGWKKLLSFMSGVKDATKAVAGTVGGVEDIIHEIADAAG